MCTPGDPGGYEVAMRRPLVVFVGTGARHQVEVLASRLSVDFPAERFVGIVAAATPDDLAATLTIMRTALEEVIFTDSTEPHGIRGADLATRALGEYRMGQDFVFTIADISDATGFAINVLTDERRNGWEGTAILVLGSPTDIDAARDTPSRRPEATHDLDLAVAIQRCQPDRQHRTPPPDGVEADDAPEPQ